jgi:ABC-type Na+ efflux pump permease subunit
MATWRAKCWLGSSSGYQDLEVQSNTLNGAKEQLERIYGAEQIINLREVRESRKSSSSSESSDGSALLVGIVILFVAVVTWWYYIIPAAIIIGILWYLGTRES